MRISNLIRKLQRIQESKGDLNLYEDPILSIVDKEYYNNGIYKTLKIVIE